DVEAGRRHVGQAKAAPALCVDARRMCRLLPGPCNLTALGQRGQRRVALVPRCSDTSAAFAHTLRAYAFLNPSASPVSCPSAGKSALRGEVPRHTRPTTRPGSGSAKRSSLTRSSRASTSTATFGTRVLPYPFATICITVVRLVAPRPVSGLPCAL